MSKTLILIDTNLNTEREITWKADLLARLKEDGRWEICKLRKKIFATNHADFVDLFCLIADLLEIDLNSPEALTPKCLCPTKCDCQDPDNGYCSNSCPIHNEDPDPDPDCPQHLL